jgi:hypothetical protein
MYLDSPMKAMIFAASEHLVVAELRETAEEKDKGHLNYFL